MKRFLTLCISILIGVVCISATGPYTRRSGPHQNLNPWGSRIMTSMPRKAAQPVIPGLRQGQLPGTVAKLFAKGRKAPSAAPALKDGLYGWMTYTAAPDADTRYGLNYLTDKGDITNVIQLTDGRFTGLWYRDGKWCSYSPQTASDGSVADNLYIEIDASTGQVAAETPLANTLDKVFILTCYDHTGDVVYGYTYNETGQGIQFSKASGSNPAEIVKVADADISHNCRALAYNTAKGVVAGINGEGALVEIDPTTGAQTVVGTPDVPYFYIAGMAYDETNDSYIYNAQPQENSTYLYSIDATTLESTLICTYPYGDSFIGLYIMGDEAFPVNRSAPALADGLNANFIDGALTGEVLFNLPAATLGGSPILGNVSWVFSIDGKEVRRGSSPAGSAVTVGSLELAEGVHEFSVVCSLGINTGEAASAKIYVGNDTPLAPTNVTLLADKITWDAVTAGVHAGYVNPDEVTYNVWLGGDLIAEGISATETATNLTEGQPLHIYTANVTASFAGKESDVATSNDLTYGDGLMPPVYLRPTDNEIPLFTTLDANGDGKTVKFGTQLLKGEKVSVVYCDYNRTAPNDDWLWLPAVILNDAATVYRFEMHAALANQFPERFEVRIGKAATVEAMTSTIIATTDVDILALNKGGDFVTYGNEFIVSDPGKYYIGIHYMSDADQFRLMLNDFRVTSTDYNPKGPKPVEALEAVAGATGALEADVSFKMPSADILGTPYAADKELKAYVTVGDDEDEIEVSGKPGETVGCKVTTQQGMNTISVFPADGTDHGPAQQTTVFTGLDVPTIVNDFDITTSDDNMDIILSWSAPTEGENGGYVAPTGITYYLAQVIDGYWDILGAVGTDVFTYTVSLPAGTPQNLYTLGILAGNASGRASSLTGQSIEAGIPYMLPIRESFTDASVEYTPLANYTGGDYVLQWGFGDPATIDPNLENGGKTGFIGYSNASGIDQKGKISLPRFSTKGIKKPAIILETLGVCCYSADVYASASGVPAVKLETIDIANLPAGDQSVTVNLPEQFADCGWVQIDIEPSVDVNYYYSDAFVLYGYTIKNMEPYDFAVSAISGNTVMQYGEDCRFSAVINNEGTEANRFPGGKWTLSDAEGNVVASVNVPAGTDEMAPAAVMEAPIVITPTADMGNKLHLSFEITAGDNSNVNDGCDIDLNVVKGDALIITDLKASDIDYNSVTLAWSAPNGAETVQGFEEETPFVMNPENIAGFRNIDRDGAPTYTFQGGEQIPGAQQPGSFTVWSSEGLASYMNGATLPAADGDKFLIAFSAAPAAQGAAAPCTDDWLISPAVAGGTMFSFAACPVSYLYPETLQVLCSSTDDNVESFTIVKEIILQGTEDATQLDWQEISVPLPADAKYVAICYVSEDMLGVMLDKIAYTPADAVLDIAGYNIYRNGEALAQDAPCTGNSYVDDSVEADTPYAYVVVPVLADGTVGLNSNTLHLRTSGVGGIQGSAKAIYAADGIISVKGYAGMSIAIADISGITVAGISEASASEVFSVAPGVYIVKAGSDTVKLIVK